MRYFSINYEEDSATNKSLSDINEEIFLTNMQMWNILREMNISKKKLNKASVRKSFALMKTNIIWNWGKIRKIIKIQSMFVPYVKN